MGSVVWLLHSVRDGRISLCLLELASRIINDVFNTKSPVFSEYIPLPSDTLLDMPVLPPFY